uniref:uncharacterized protein LOC122608605 n=1 Tax=Erigeron canadensis TaxID=72917 RepID=UPI001CB9D005|nr:uncharacterized protein LOC122608605 [Erigeron canadensis]
MEQNFVVITKKAWRLVRVMFFMLKKGIAKRKFLLDLSMMLKRGKITSKASTIPKEYEFSCRDTPPYPLSLFSSHKKHENKHSRLARSNTPLVVDDCDDIIINPAVLKALDMMTSRASPKDEQLMRMDSPAAYNEDKDDCVDEAAENFIRRFYNDRIRTEN